MDGAEGELVGREHEIALINGLLARARRGEGGVLTFRGEPGSGKTSLLAKARELADDFAVVSCCGVEWETEIPFAALHELVLPFDALHDALPVPQRRELEGALGRRDSGVVQSIHVHAAALSLLLEASRERPVLVIADDLQWIDAISAQALAFAGRRIPYERVAILAATRPGALLPGLPEPIDLRPLDRAAVGELAARQLGGRTLPDAALDELTRASGGNPLAVAESAAHAGDQLWLRGAGLDTPLPVGALIERGFSERLEGLSADARAAAELVAESIADDDITIRRAIAELGLPGSALTEGVDRRVLVGDGGRWRFSHPLLRSIVHGRAAGPERRAAHAALARATPSAPLAAWHAAEAADGPDAAVADALAEAAEGYLALSGSSAAARAFERAAELTPDPDAAAARFIEAARAARYSGAGFDRVHELVARAGGLAVSETTRVRAELELLLLRQGTDDARALFEQMYVLFERVRELDDDLAAELTRVMANDALLQGAPDLVHRSLELMRELPLDAMTDDSRLAIVSELVVTAVFHGDAAVREEELVEAAAELQGRIAAGVSLMNHAGTAALLEGLLWIEQLELADQTTREFVGLARAQGDAFNEVVGLIAEAEIALRLGEWSRSVAITERSVVLSELAGMTSATSQMETIGQLIAGLRTGVTDTQVLDHAQQIGDDWGITIMREYVLAARALTALTAGEPAIAAEHLEAVRAWKRGAGQVEPSIATWPVDLVLAHALAGNHAAARDALDELREHAEQRGRRWALAAVPWLEAILEADQTRAFELFELALERYPAAQVPFDEARARLAYGQRLRRARRRADARVHLEAAQATFERLDAEPWAQRCRRELGASGQAAARRAGDEQRDALTLQERQVAALVAAGASNKEAAGELYLSPKTIETHLSRVYRKLGIGTRTQLAARWGELSNN
ncbi:MAG: AAA family ATPase [Solirubrobacteraceae bacterium]|nr:AAA family ATPase [Solirubrobacteraceae bacterium]